MSITAVGTFKELTKVIPVGNLANYGSILLVGLCPRSAPGTRGLHLGSCHFTPSSNPLRVQKLPRFSLSVFTSTTTILMTVHFREICMIQLQWTYKRDIILFPFQRKTFHTFHLSGGKRKILWAYIDPFCRRNPQDH